MSREDRRPLPQLPEDSVNTDMYPLAPTQESFTLNPSYNPTEPYFFDNLAYCPDISASYLSHYSPTNLSHHQPTDAQNFVAYGAEHSLPFVPKSSSSDAVFHILDPSTAALDFGAFAALPDFTLPDHFPEFFKDVEYCQELQAVPPTSPVASNMNMPSLVKRKGRRKSQPVRFPSPPVSGFDSSNALYLESLDCYVQHLQQLFDFIGVEPLPLELAENYGGLSCRSIRSSVWNVGVQTIVFHLEKTVDALRGFVIQEEDKFEALGRLGGT
ncbi:hypothetical protein GGX14DRAFT_638834 [Mycena pura]|uniref:Uncharacterized protein n=1 Tax=Mycena pura TaxID=153505 RepID=A0AAD7E3B3_9AGAR|nr:hypothetical protein GGX14DRAFT_638834 [Mycena pura]